MPKSLVSGIYHTTKAASKVMTCRDRRLGTVILAVANEPEGRFRSVYCDHSSLLT